MANNIFFGGYKGLFQAVSVLIILAFNLSPIAPVFALTGPPTVTNPTVFSLQSATPKVDGTSGALTQTIPLDVPPGRNSLQPDLSLDYNSQDTDQDSIIGYGWSLSIPYVERLNKTGSQNLYSPNAYFTSSLDGELATTTTGTTTPQVYRARVDDGSFRQYTYATSTNSWTMYDKNGNEYLFGASSQSQQSATTSPTLVYKWMLEKQIDTNGNYVRYVYNKDGNQIYPYQIIYTGNGVTDGPLTITFATSTRPDKIVSFKSDFLVTTNYRVSQITAAVNGTTVRQYNLGYTTGNNGFRSMLSSVQENGWDDNSVETSDPAMTFGYVNSSNSFLNQGGVYNSVSNSADVVADANGDGINDINNFYVNSGGTKFGFVDPSGGSGISVTPPDTWANDVQRAQENGVRYVDVTGDGKANVVGGLENDHTPSTSTEMYINTYATSTGYAWTSTSTVDDVIPYFAWIPTSAAFVMTTGILGDVNGDGLPDFVKDIQSGTPTQSPAESTYLGNGSSWTATTTIYSAPYPVPEPGVANNYDPRLVDIIGDGLEDYEFTDGASIYFLQNTGTGWGAADPRYTIATSSVYETGGGAYYDRGIRFVDINGDGLPDYIHSYSYPADGCGPEAATYSTVMLNTGLGWATSTAYTIANPVVTNGGNCEDFDELVNFTGNGQQDQDVLSTITYLKGGSTSITYGYTTQSGANTQLPYNILTVTKIVNHDGLGSNEETDYTYNNGLQYLPFINVFDRRFAGFGWVVASTSIATTFTYYSQGATSTAAAAGDQSDGYGQINHPYRADVFNPTGTLVQSTFYQYNPISHGNSEFVGLTRQLEQDYSSNGTHQDKDTDYVYSTTTDNLIQQNDYGAVTGNSDGTFTDITGDSRTTNIAYAASSSVNLSVPTEKTLLNNSGATTTDTKLFYDGLSFGKVNVGNLTQEQDLISTSTLTYASSTKTYNSYGLVTQSKDRDGNATTYSYESFNLYPATTTDALSHSTKYTYDYSNGKAEKTTNPNAGITKNIYDGLGKLIEVDQSNPSSPSTLATSTTYQFTDNSVPPSIIHETDYLNSATTTNTYNYYDGLDRLIQDRKSTENSGTSTVTDFIYNTVGKLSSQSLPYFSLGTASTTATTTTALYTNYAYDALGRILTTANAVGTTANVYSAWKTITTDPNGDIKDSILDALGNLAQVVEHGAISNATTTYTYDAANNLTNITDALSNIRNFTYDGLGDRLTAQDLHASGDSTFGSWTYSYDPMSNLISQTDPKSQVITHTYDALNRMLTEAWTGQGTQVTDTYDSCTNGTGLLCTASSTAAKDTYAYDVLGRTTSATTTISGTSYGLAYGYDRQGNITSVTNNTDGVQVNYTYNTAGLASAINRTIGGVNSLIASLFNYSPTNQPGQVVFGSGASTTYSYNPAALYRLTRILTTGAPTTTASRISSPFSVLVVAGGGGGGSLGGGGGGGGYVYNPSFTAAIQSYPVTVGAGGIGAPGNGTFLTGASGSDSIFDTIDAAGGGGGAGHNQSPNSNGLNGGSGGGANSDGTGGTGSQGNKGGDATGAFGGLPSGGGGGASAAAANNTSQSATAGGAGSSNSISGSSVTYAGGGGGGDQTDSGTPPAGGAGGGGAGTTSSIPAVSGTANTGGGGGGGGQFGGSGGTGGTGGSGIEIMSYPTASASEYTCGGSTTTSGTSTICTFTSNGTFAVLSGGTTTQPAILQDLNYTYDADGNILTHIDNSNSGLGQQVTYTYDNLNRLLSASTTILNTNAYDQTFTYDALGNILTGPNGTYSYQGNTGSSYANPDAVTQILLTTGASAPTIAFDNSGLGGNGTPASSLTFSYTTNSNTNGIIIVGVNESAATSTCGTDKVTGVTDNGTSLTDAGYYVDNTTTVNGALKTYYGFSPATSTHNIVVSASASCILYATAVTYTGVKQSGFPDASGSGNPLSDSGSITTFQATTTTANRNAWAVLMGVPSAAGTATVGSNTTIRQQQSGDLYYADSNGPIAPAGPFGLNWSMSSPTHWAANYFSLTPVTSIPGTTATTTYAYDNNGNVTAVSTTTSYSYDFDNRLIQSSIGNGHATTTTTYGYDPFGSRVFQGTGTATTTYPNQYYSIVATTVGSSTIATSTDYVYGGSTLFATIDQKLVNGTATGTAITRYNHPDNLGSTQVTSDSSGNLAQWFDYGPYGSLIASSNTGTTTAARQYIGQFSDASGLSYLNARYYNGAQGQFTTQDPVFLGQPSQQKLQDPQSLNAYSYSEGNPIIKSDPNGKQLNVVGEGAESLIQNAPSEWGEIISALSAQSFQEYQEQAVSYLNPAINDITSLPNAIPTRLGSKLIYLSAGTIALIGAGEDFGQSVLDAIDKFAGIPTGPSTPIISAYNANPNANYFTQTIGAYKPQQTKTTSSTYNQTSQNTGRNTSSSHAQSASNSNAGYSSFVGLFNPFVPQSVSTPAISK